jgi:hypothetical protein
MKFLLLLLISGAASAAPEFSADVVDGDTVRHLYVTDGKVRIDADGGYYLIEGGKAVFVKPERRIFMDVPAPHWESHPLEHLQVGPQPASLFIIPADYRKLDPQALIKRIQKSDVWVESPK